MQTIANQDQIDALKMNTSLLVISYTFLVLVRPLVRPPFPLGMLNPFLMAWIQQGARNIP